MSVIAEYEFRTKVFIDAGNGMVSAVMVATAGVGLFDGAAGAAAEDAAGEAGAERPTPGLRGPQEWRSRSYSGRMDGENK
jgi:hypothetical protein